MRNARSPSHARVLRAAELALCWVAAWAVAPDARADERLALQAPTPPLEGEAAPAPRPPRVQPLPDPEPMPAPASPPPPPAAPPPPPPAAPPPAPPAPDASGISQPSPAAPPSAPDPPAEPATAAAAGRDTASESSDADALAALAADLSSATEVPTLNPDDATFSVYGFADFSYFTQIGEKVILANQQPTFMVGNFNVYFSSEFERRWRFLSEVRFLYAPHGAWLADSPLETATSQRGDTSFLDGSDLNHPMRWGRIAIQRVWLEYKLDEYLTLRAGQWLTPYGIWNVDHGSPTIIGVYKPYVINQNWFPEQQTGIEAYGSVYLDDTQLGYHLTLSNGRGPIDAYRDLDNNKALGGRLYAKNDALLGTITLGLSAYRGNYTDRAGNGVAIVDNALVPNDPPTLRYEEVAYAADLKWEWEGLLVQSEYVMRDVRYTDAVRPRAVELPPSPPGFQPDTREMGVYVLVGYRTPWLALMPFAMFQYINLFTDSQEYSVGLNLRPSPRVAIKAEYKYILVDPTGGIELGDLDFLGLQLAWSF
jgi:hypothetical protein